ncbi:MAG: hypothetical protein OZSIB_1436 [Candidatus Ozemobacter sibiricus]|uniref:ADP,ATP carrier protein n=1 Tax=Candidatus Ozemobacter sibiricus TaxID=2268124 RepID=A0A367ZK89_9BACT|nr:MAG: hypothetical protein OZSIB_1436 [Candidatus Ozemobacter sibiricus]
MTPSQGSPVRLLAAQFLAQKASNNLLYLSLLTVYLKNAGAGGLPWVYVLVNLAFVALQFGTGRFIADREGHGLLTMLSWPTLAFAMLGGALLVEGASPHLLLVCLVIAVLIDLFTNQSFSHMANQYLPLQEAKQAMPVIYAAGSIGYILSGILMKFVLDLVGIRGLLWFTALLLIVQHLLLGALQPFEAATRRPASAAGREPGAPLAPSPAAPATAQPAEGSGNVSPARGVLPSWHQPLARLLISSSFLILFNKYLIDFLFADAVNRHFANAQELAVFMGVFGASTDITVIGLQTVVMHRIFAHFPIGRVLMLLPALLVLLCSKAALGSGFLLVTTIQFFVLVNSKNFTVPATSILLSAVRQGERSLYRRDIGIVCSLSSLLVGGLLLLVRGTVSPEGLFLAAAVVYGAMVWVHSRLDAAYAHTLRKTIADQALLDEEPDWLEAIRFLAPRERVSRLRDLLEHPDPAIRRGTVAEVAILPPEDVKNLLLPKLTTEKDPACLGALARTMLEVLGPAALCNLEILLAGNEDPRLTADLLEAIGRVGSGEAVEDMVELFLTHDHHRIRGSAAISLLRLTRRPDRLELALGTLARMARDPSPLCRATAAAAMGELANPLFIASLEALSLDPDETVVRNALKALARLRTSRALAILESRCRHPSPGVAAIAQQLFREASRQGIERIAALLQGFSGPERQRLAHTLKTLRGELVLDLLARILRLEAPEAREILTRLLQEGEAETISLLDQCLLVPADDAPTTVRLAPAWERLAQTWPTALPRWSEALPALAGAARPPSADEPGLVLPPEDALPSILPRIWQEGLALEAAADLLPIPPAPDLLARLRRFWLRRVETVARCVALCAPDPAPLLRAIDQLTAGDPFTRSVARELLETHLGPAVSSWLTPLLDPSLLLTPGALRQEAEKRGLAVLDTSAEAGGWRSLLQQIIQVEATS